MYKRQTSNGTDACSAASVKIFACTAEVSNGFSTNTGQDCSIHSKPLETCNGVGVDNIIPSGDIAVNISFRFEKQGTSKEFMSSVGFGSTIATNLTSLCFEIALICLCPTNPAPTTASLIILVISFLGK